MKGDPAEAFEGLHVVADSTPPRAMPTLPARLQEHMRVATAREISTMSRYYDRVVQYAPTPNDAGELLAKIDAPEKTLLAAGEELPDMTGEVERRSLVLLNGSQHYDYDLEATLRGIRERMSRSTRLVMVAYNPYQKLLQDSAYGLVKHEGAAPTTFVTLVQLRTLARLAGLQIVRTRPAAVFPVPLGPLGGAVERAVRVTPGVNRLSATWVITLRSTHVKPSKPSLSIVIPARDERGNIEDALRRLRYLNDAIDMEVIFVEGHSSDGTWEEIQRVRAAYQREFSIQAFRQSGVGKNDAVRLGFQNANKDLLTILDADLTMPPELLHRFYDAYTAGMGDFINGDRLTYPMEGEAMRPLNHLGNLFFAKALSGVLDTPLGDSLCGTKLLSASDYQRILAWRRDFGDFDPFGDFELLFPAAVLALGIADIPIRYRDRQYGSTSISRFRHGAQLLKMTAVGLTRIKGT